MFVFILKDFQGLLLILYKILPVISAVNLNLELSFEVSNGNSLEIHDHVEILIKATQMH